ncbi:MAG: AEC family transporter [Candidatus Izemoplasmataceae bacterium]
MDALLFSIQALMPLLLLALLGAFLVKVHILNDHFADQMNRYIFYVALPVAIFLSLARSDLLETINFSVIGFIIGIFLLTTLIGYLIVNLTPFEKAKKAVLMQAVFRGNFVIIGLPLAERLGGANAVTYLVIANAFILPLTNTLSIFAFKWFKDKDSVKESLSHFLKKTFLNPIMLSIYLGISFFFLKILSGLNLNQIPFVEDTLTMINQTLTPLALIAIGAKIKLSRLKLNQSEILVSVGLRMSMVPVVAFSLVYLFRNLFNFGDAYITMIALFASPVAIASVAVTKGLNGDDEFASQVVIATTICAVVTLFIAITLFKSLGLI